MSDDQTESTSNYERELIPELVYYECTWQLKFKIIFMLYALCFMIYILTQEQINKQVTSTNLIMNEVNES